MELLIIVVELSLLGVLANRVGVAVPLTIIRGSEKHVLSLTLAESREDE